MRRRHREPRVHNDACRNIVNAASGEQCDDRNNSPGDGCSALWLIESGWMCVGEPSTCVAD